MDSGATVLLADLIQDGTAELQTGPFGTMLHASAYRDEGIPVVAVQHIGDGRISHHDLPRVDCETFERLRRYSLIPGDIVFSRKGSVERVALVSVDEAGWLQGSDCIRLRFSDTMDPRFAAYHLRSARIRSWLMQHAHGATMPSLNQEILSRLRFPLIPLPDQAKIAGVLGALDDKIELNRQMNKTLEELARAIFKSWFVDFDPVHARASGQQPIGMDPETAALFPDSFQDSSLGPIPTGWCVGSVDDVAKVVYGAAFSSKLFSSAPIGRPLLRIRDLATHRPEIYTAENHPKGHVVNPGDVVAGMDGEFRVHLWTGEQVWLNQRVCKFAPQPGNSESFVRFVLEEPLCRFEQSKSGTTVIHLGKSDIDSVRFALPPECVRNSYGDLVNPISGAIVANAQQSRTLAQIRDLLLPKLLSGEVRVGTHRNASAVAG